MIYFLIGILVSGGLWWISRSGPKLKRREWRLVSGGLALGAFSASAYEAMRGGWSPAIILFLLGLWLASTTRASAAPVEPPVASSLDDTEARKLLGVGPEAGRREILEAYARLIKLAHPDKGGTHGLAAQINAARDRLLRKASQVS
ncbi:MAG: molecular chaperone DnaJ [Phenylobacterium zucineum]|nr:MAG: molecular chaperone DnaJ [Phenylobacterium zucineum]